MTNLSQYGAIKNMEKENMKKLTITAVMGFMALTICTIFLGVFRIEIVLRYIVDETFAKAILLPVNFLYIFLISYALVRINQYSMTSKTAIWIGVIWAFSALILDLFVGYNIEERSISYLLEQFNILQGSTWTVVLLLIAIMPNLVWKRINKKVV